MSQRDEFVRLACVEGVNVAELCRRFGVSRKTGYKWRNRYLQDPQTPLLDQSRRPADSPGRTSSEIEQRVLAVRDAHPAWGGRKIGRRLTDLGQQDVPSKNTITAILKRHGRISDAESAKHRPWTRFEKEHPNELWQVDFKGEFRLSSQRYCYPLTILDDHSRFSLGIFACGNQKRLGVQAHFRKTFGIYGLPQAIYVDNGNPWANASNPIRHTKFSAWLMRQDIRVIYGKPYHPQGRGKLERFHRTMKLELLQDRQLTSLKDAQSSFDPWRDMYNQERPHEALSLDTPCQHYRISERRYVPRVRRFQYSDRYEVRQPNAVGQFSFGGHTYRISEAFANEPVGLSATSQDGIWDVWYCRFVVACLNEHERTITRHQPRS